MSALPSMTSHLTSAMQPEPLSQRVDAICPQHGRYMDVITRRVILGSEITTSKGCQQCHAESREAEATRQQQQDASRKAARIRQLVDKAGIPERFMPRTLANFHAEQPGQKIALAVCQAYVDAWPAKLQTGASLVLTGKPGTGKTHLACAVGNEVIRSTGAAVLFITVAAMLRAIKETYRKDSELTEGQAIAGLMLPDLLIIDEIGVQVGSEHEKLLMFEVLNERYQRLKPTILISNLDVDDLEHFLGNRVMDRYRECGAVLAFDWQSHRGTRTRPTAALPLSAGRSREGNSA